ncbi:MAG TPA: hypothetical protein VJY39_19110 [Acidisphaera sp.]|nr:hypothetical protein [Acidisphaera sp.]
MRLRPRESDKARFAEIVKTEAPKTYEAGFRVGAFDALCDVSPDHARVLSFCPKES